MISDMKKLLLFGNNSEKSELMKILHKMGCVEISLAKKLDKTQYVVNEDKINEYTRKLTKLEFLFDFFAETEKEVAKYAKTRNYDFKPVKTSGLLIPKKSLTFEEFAASQNVEKEVFEVIDKLDKFSAEIIELKSDNTKYLSIANQLAPYKAVTAKLNSFKSTKHVVIALGSIGLSALNRVGELEEKGAYVEVFKDERFINIAVMYLKEKEQEIQEILTQMDFAVCSLNFDGYASDLISDAERHIKANEERIIDIYFEAIKDEQILFAAQQLHDFYTLEVRKVECEGFTLSTQTSYLLEGWVPAKNAEELDKALSESPLALSYVIREPIEGDNVPTYCENNEVVSPYESVTNMFSSPAYKEIDPNPFVAFFFFIFFGMMLSDAGYGLVLTILTGIVLLMTKPKKGQSNLIKIVFMGGISTIIWGFLFGSYFGLNAKDLGIWYWFNPIDSPMNMLYLSLAMGIFQMLFGTMIKAVAEFKAKNIAGGVTAFCWLFLVLGVGGFALPMVVKTAPAFIKIVGIVFLAIGAVLLMAGGALGKKGAAKVTGALASLYDIINFFSDLMSYTRIFGLGLATAVIGMVFNEIGTSIASLLGGGVAGVIVIIIIALIGHTFNIAINALGAYVHNSRLQFVEFFGKFYTGGGTLFKPLGSEMKYYYINNEKTQEVK
ncbi:MAG: hypothetical protein E7338_06185 [Clostridiales bacterium]|nr:hypothetical protein [Clostridiales bacterium]